MIDTFDVLSFRFYGRNSCNSGIQEMSTFSVVIAHEIIVLLFMIGRNLEFATGSRVIKRTIMVP